LDVPQLLTMVPPTVSKDQLRTAFRTGLRAAAARLVDKGFPVDARRLYDAVLGPVAPPPQNGSPAESGQQLAAPAGAPKASAGNGRVPFAKLSAAVLQAESGGNPHAVSVKGAVGTMQTMPGTLSDPGFGVRPAADNSPAELERVGKDYLKAMLSRYKGDIVLGLAAYNAGPAQADQWQANMTGKSIAQKVAMIPFAETRGYVGRVLGAVGVTAPDGEISAAPTAPTPAFRLSKPEVSPLQHYLAAGDTLPLAGLSTLELTAADRIAMTEERDHLTARAEAEWQRRRDEDQTFKASSVALRLYGQGDPVTSVEITQAIQSGEVTPQQGLTLYNILRSNTAEAQSAQDRAETRQDREQHRRREEQASAVTGRYTAAVLSGRMTGAQARAAVLKELPSIADPVVKAAVANSVLATASDIERLRVESQPVRESVRRIADSRDFWISKAGRRGTALAPKIDSTLDQAQTEIAMRVRDGEDPSAAEKAVLGKYKPRLLLLVSGRAAHH